MSQIALVKDLLVAAVVAGVAGGIILVIRGVVLKVTASRAIRNIPNFRSVVFDSFETGCAIAIDPSRNQIAIRDRKGKIDRFDFSEIVGAEVVRNGQTVIKTNRGSQLAGAAVGGLLFGAAGAIVGGLSGSERVQEKIRKLSLKLYTRDLHRPIREVVAYEGHAMSAFLHQSGTEKLDNWYGRMRVILESRDFGAARIEPRSGLSALRHDRG